MKLFVDDIRNAPDDSWSVARSVDSAISFIAQFGHEITEISLDHDISHQVGMGELSRPYPCAETFTPVARYMRLYWDTKYPKVTIHTSNPSGAEKMRSILDDFPEVTFKSSVPANRLESEV